MSYYAAPIEPRNDDNTAREQICQRCKGLGEDAQGADCLACEGFGSILLRF